MRFLIFSLSILCAVGCSTPNTATSTSSAETTGVSESAATYAGEWDVTVSDTPAGTVTGTIMLMEGEDGLTGKFSSGGSETDLRSVRATEEGLSITFYSSQYQTDVDMKLTGQPTDDTLTGTTLGSYRTEAVRKN